MYHMELFLVKVPLKTNVTPVEPITPPAATSSNLLPGNMGISIPTIPATFSADYTVPLTTYSSVASSTLGSTMPGIDFSLYFS